MISDTMLNSVTKGLTLDIQQPRRRQMLKIQVLSSWISSASPLDLGVTWITSFKRDSSAKRAPLSTSIRPKGMQIRNGWDVRRRRSSKRLRNACRETKGKKEGRKCGLLERSKAFSAKLRTRLYSQWTESLKIAVEA